MFLVTDTLIRPVFEDLEEFGVGAEEAHGVHPGGGGEEQRWSWGDENLNFF